MVGRVVGGQVDDEFVVEDIGGVLSSVDWWLRDIASSMLSARSGPKDSVTESLLRSEGVTGWLSRPGRAVWAPCEDGQLSRSESS
jgi:hypothetical protein